MSNVYTLDSLKSELDKEFAPLQLDIGGETLTLRNLMRISDTDRNAVLGALDAIEAVEVPKNEDGTEQETEQSAEDIAAMSEALSTVFRAVTANGKGERLVKEIDGDITLAMKIMDLWTAATQPGEAQNSSD